MKRLMHYFLSIFCSATSLLSALSNPLSDEEARKIEAEEMLERSKQVATLYELPEGTDLLEITDKVLKHSLTLDSQKELIISTGRRIFLFIYPSDELKIKGVISFLPQPEFNPLLVVLRGGNKEFAVLHPSSKLLTPSNYTTITTTYRDGFSEGSDEFGGADVNDVKNLMNYIPILESQLSEKFSEQKKYILGTSRGGMQMFLSLARFPELQTYFSKAISLSGLLDMEEAIESRRDMKEMFIEAFGLIEGVNEEDWISYRNPILAAEKIDPNLPIYIIQGTDDNRVSLNEGYHMVEKLQLLGNHVEYLEVEGGTHCLGNREDYMDIILDFVER